MYWTMMEISQTVQVLLQSQHWLTLGSLIFLMFAFVCIRGKIKCVLCLLE